MKPVTIIGGGLAGLTLGLALRKRGVPVAVREAGAYPRHRVCGEFISGKGQEVLRRLGLAKPLQQAGVLPARTAQFIFPKAASPVRLLPEPALCVSRLVLDAMLASEFEKAGGVLRCGERCPAEPGEGSVHAAGRKREAGDRGWRWFGLKVHARNVALQADLEMHAQPDGYVGLSWLPGGEVNICGLFRRRLREVQSQEDFTGGLPGLRGGFARLGGGPGSALRARLSRATFDEASFCSVAGLAYHAAGIPSQGECRVGDAMGLIPPATGNGMSMAFESAELAVDPLTRWSRSELSWIEACDAVARTCRGAFRRRLAWARFLQWMMFTPLLRTRSAGIVLRSEWLWQHMFARTR